MKIKRPSICMKIKGISNLIHQELGTNRDTVHPGTMMQKMFLGYLEVHEDQPVFQKDLESAFHIRRSTATGILQIMVRDGLIVREPVEDDARLKRLVRNTDRHRTAGANAAGYPAGRAESDCRINRRRVEGPLCPAR